MQSAVFRPDFAEGVAGVNMSESDAGATEELVAAARGLGAVAAGGSRVRHGRRSA